MEKGLAFVERPNMSRVSEFILCDKNPSQTRQEATLS